MEEKTIRMLVEEATLDFTLGNNAAAIEKLEQALEAEPDCFEAWHALAEVCFSERSLDLALEAAEKAVALRPEDIHIHTSLSRIWMERGDKAKAEEYGAKARMLGWQEELKSPPEEDGLEGGSG